MTSRRELLKGGAFLGGAAAISGILPASIQRALAITADPGTTYLDAEHIVVLMQENRSFDHMFGTMQGVRGFNDPRPVRQADGSSVFFQKDKNGTAYAPWRLDTKASNISWLGAIPHGRTDQVDAWNGGLHNNWIEAKRSGREDASDIPLTMGYCTREDMPFYYALADAFTVCDQNYCSLLTMTAPNRLMMWNGTIREPTKNGSLVYMYNHMTHIGGLTWTSFGERLYDAGVDWKCYQNHIYCETPYFGQAADSWLGNDGDNSMERLGSYATEFSPQYRSHVDKIITQAQGSIALREAELQVEFLKNPTPELQKKLKAYAEQRALLEEKRKASHRSLAECTDKQMALRARGLAINSNDPDYLSLDTFEYEVEGEKHSMSAPKGDILYQFRDDVKNGKLPTVSWLVAPSNFSFHPGSPWFGEWYVSEIINILTENPEVWKKTIFILTFDENDGFFDHSPSFVAADPARPETGRASEGINTGEEYTSLEDDLLQGISKDNARAAPFGLGYRVPMIIASPWSRGGWVNSQLSDHTSVIQFIQKFVETKYGKSVLENNISDWRRTICSDLTSCFHQFDDKPSELNYLQKTSHLQMVASAKHKPLPEGWKNISSNDLNDIKRYHKELKQYLWQELGVRKSCALPYELLCHGTIDSDAQKFRLTMKSGNELFGTNSSGAPFNVYLYNTKSSSQRHTVGGLNAPVESMTFTVRSGDELIEDIDLDRFKASNYDIAVHGPNGFYRHFKGGKDEYFVSAECRYVKSNPEILELYLKNETQHEMNVLIESNSYNKTSKTYKMASSERRIIAIDLQKSKHWYDFTVRIKESPRSWQNFAGHVETGLPSYTDPAMAG